MLRAAVPSAKERSTFLVVGGRIIVMKKLLLLVGNEDTKEFEATNLGPSCPLFAYNENEGKK